MKHRSLFTKAVHAGEDRAENFGALSTPIYNASVFAFENADEAAAIHNHVKPGYYYGRLGNPTQETLEKAVADLEGADDALAFASGMAAISAAILTVAKSGDHIVALESMYSTTTSLLNHLAENFGLEVTYVDATDPENYRQAARPSTKLFWIETPSNPVLNVTDISAVCGIAKENGIVTCADNTFATPFNQNPLSLGADLVVHSATKYLGGHSDLTAGILAGDSSIVEEARMKTTRYFGGNIAPQVAWLVMRGIKTLALRMDKHNQNAYAVAHMLSDHPKVDAVFYPGFGDHPGHTYAVKQMRGFGGMVAFDVGGIEAGKRFINALELVSIATSLGGVESIIQHSASMTHASLSPEARKLAGISDGMMRFSVGVEDMEDILDDLRSALEAV
ncbi:MAG: aminotransferase class I/II-fold pyridoxal phosphate-dependent enzyme [Acidobacteriota bacterium]|nr:MAG: aminotransferase class I/II-fold pyridoxal phosphate-dependent enzyme [Acidobacteriota bacterium]